MSLPSAEGAAVLRAAQKDDYFVKRLSASALEVLRLFGNKLLNDYARYVPAASFVTYRCLTTLRGLQTFGEEYTGIVQVDDTYTRVPGKFLRLISILLGAFGEVAVRRSLDRVKSDIRANEELLPSAKLLLLKFVTIIMWLLPALGDLHQTWFYVGGKHYEISKRLTRINYVNALPGPTAQSSILRTLGVPYFLKTVFNAFNSPPCFETFEQEAAEGSSMENSCAQCLEKNLTPCALPCGHILCNKCSRSGYVCPFCRAPYHPNRTVPLQNFAYT